MVGLDDCGRSIFGVMESLGQMCFSWVSLLLAVEISFYENLEALFFLLATANDNSWLLETYKT